MSSKSLIPTHPSSSSTPSSSEHLPLSNLTSIFYDSSARPFSLFGLSFSELPEATQGFLKENAARLPTRLCLSEDEEENDEEEDGDGDGDGDKEGLNAYFGMLLKFREEEQERLGRTLEGVHRAIVLSMLTAKTTSPTSTHTHAQAQAREEAETELRTILVPEWRSHLDDYVDRIDALIWFETEMRRGTVYEMGYEQCVWERREDVQRMVLFAVRGLQGVHETMMGERGERELGVGLGVVGGELEGHISDDSRSGNGSGSGDGSSGSGSSDEYEDEDEDEESIFSESDFDLGCTSDSNSEAQWVSLDSTFTMRRIG
ncbi:hypothetical protein GALMADRAFT_231767 [Galerina marginata CBS 339.88]|uniref:Uncharacterized protein n=1 Tax=Galerina marginata (strain CBS 339.88) TaxID=685588 RepID=A0A067SAI4_GALM3|nr:hypothetical protein GALMADRAFT_231767 [Galerina marginata CBS 339.88]